MCSLENLYNLQLLRSLPRVLFPAMAAHPDDVDNRGRDLTAWLPRKGRFVARLDIDPQVSSTSLHHGQLQGRHRGRISFEQGKKAPAPLRALTCPATTTRVVTVITLA